MVTCPVCGRESEEGFRFCPGCGAALEEASPARSATERKVVSVLFCDVVGFTSSSESTDPEDVQARMQPYYARLRKEIEAYGGTVEKFIGDAVMAVFGVPVAHEDDPERAVRAGLRILEAIADLNEADPRLELQVRVGINTGEVVVSQGSTAPGEAKVHGDAVNTAARIQGAAPVGAVAVGVETYRATDRVFVYEELPAFEAKGKSDPVLLWRPHEARARFGSDVIRSLTTPLVGRETDLALLRSLFDKTARDCEVQLVTVVGEPGVGKSRLVAELFAYVEERPELVTWRQGRCLPYGDGITFWALGEVVKAHAGIYESDSAEQATAKLDALLADSAEQAWLRARLLPLLGVESGQPPSREESFTAWRRFLEAIAERGPLVLIVEDIHWADEALLAFLEHLADWAQGVPLLVLCTARPELYERHAAWGSGLANQTAIRLSPLSDTDTARLISALLEQAVLPAETQQLLLERAGGNPLYAEEFVRMLRDRELLDEHGRLLDSDVFFPDSIQSLIAARLDTLAADRKSLLQDASVLGKVFWAGAVVAMGERSPHDVELALHELARKELVRASRQSSMEGESEYGFWHLLVRDVAYQQIPREARASKHVDAARWLEARAADRVEDLADVLVHHYERAMELLRAIGRDADADALLATTGRYLRLAAERATVLDARLAADLYARALHVVAPDDAERGHLLLAAAEVFMQTARYEEVDPLLSEAEEWYAATGDRPGMARALLAQAHIRRHEGASLVQGVVLSAIDLLDGLEVPELAAAYARMAKFAYVGGHDRDAISWAERSIALAETIGVPQEITALGARGGGRAALGDRGGLDDMRRAIVLARQTEQTRDAALWLSNLATAVSVYDGPRTSLAFARDALALAESRGLVETSFEARATMIEFLYSVGMWDQVLVEADRFEELGSKFLFAEIVAMAADVLVCRGEYAAATSRLEGVLDKARKAGEVQYVVMALSVSGALAVAQGETLVGRTLMEELLAVDELRDSYNFASYLPALVRNAISSGDAEVAEVFLEGFDVVAPMHAHALCTAEAQIGEARGDLARAASGYENAAVAWTAFGFVPEQALALLGWGRCLVALGEPGAQQPLREARALFVEMGARPRINECDTLIAQANERSA